MSETDLTTANHTTDFPASLPPLYATIMAGGAGTRFWPASRRLRPKQLLKLSGNRSMLQSTVDRVSGLCPSDQTLILTNRVLVDAVAAQLPALPAANIIGEPAKRDTAPCVALAAAIIADRHPEATMIVMPSDHVITPVQDFHSAIEQAMTMVEDDPARLVTFGIKPTYPAEVFGYIERGQPIEGSSLPAFAVNRFREKPDVKTATQFLQSGSFYWNAGIFVWKAKTILKAIERFEPQLAAHIQAIRQAIGSNHYQEVLNEQFCAIEGKSIDYAVMENYENVCVLEAPFEWNDLGNWTALPAIRGTDEQGNTVDARHLDFNSRDCILYSESDHLIVTVGLQDCIIVHTDDATLVANRTQESTIRQIVEQLKLRQWNEYL